MTASAVEAWKFRTGERVGSFTDHKNAEVRRCIYLEKWLSFVRALGQRYSNNPMLVSVKIEGVNAQTEELLLPHSRPGQSKAGKLVDCQPGDDVGEWQSIGYTAAKVKDAWRMIAQAYAQSFPAKALVVQTGPWGDSANR